MQHTGQLKEYEVIKVNRKTGEEIRNGITTQILESEVIPMQIDLSTVEHAYMLKEVIK